MMTKEELQEIIKQMPEKVSFDEVTEWYTKPLEKMYWYKREDVANIYETIPDKAIEDGELAPKWDNAYNRNRGRTPSIEDYETLLRVCKQIKLDGDDGILLSKDEKYLYFAKGEYWTRNIEKDNENKIIPIHIVVSKGKMAFSTKFKETARLDIMSVE